MFLINKLARIFINYLLLISYLMLFLKIHTHNLQPLTVPLLDGQSLKPCSRSMFISALKLDE